MCRNGLIRVTSEFDKNYYGNMISYFQIRYEEAEVFDAFLISSWRNQSGVIKLSVGIPTYIFWQR